VQKSLRRLIGGQTYIRIHRKRMEDIADSVGGEGTDAVVQKFWHRGFITMARYTCLPAKTLTEEGFSEYSLRVTPPRHDGRKPARAGFLRYFHPWGL
jgi:hypothetical protein